VEIMPLKLTFLGGAGTVTGSKYLLEDGSHRLLIDCGLFQGFKNLRLHNWDRLPVNAAAIDAVILTHAHIDHTGYLPLLIKNGFHGPVLCTDPTRDLCGILLPDSGHLQEQDADAANHHRYSRHHPALPLYTEEDANRALASLRSKPFGRDIDLPGGARVRFVRAGHILGAASLVIGWQGLTITFSGDIGRYGDPLMPDPETPARTDFLLMESTYGDRSHGGVDPQEVLARIVSETTRRGGTVVVPAFAVGRAQLLLYHINKLKAAGRLPDKLPVFLDSPMAIDATDIFRRHFVDQKLSHEDLALLARGVHLVHSAEESKALTASLEPKVVISASGMATGGRVLHHLQHYAPDPKNAILFAGFQAGGTRGAAMVDGAESIKMHGVYVPVRASVHNLSMLSAHADRDELLRWASGFQAPPRKTFIVHGEPGASDALRHALQEKHHWTCEVPEQGRSVTLA
jgi:metallo-beta-lactamase family protein